MKQSKSDPTTAAIGDGANDCSMIQEAHVGLGKYKSGNPCPAELLDVTYPANCIFYKGTKVGGLGADST